MDSRGRAVGKAHLARIRSLVIPPAWTGVWICPKDNGHIQATGRDARERKHVYLLEHTLIRIGNDEYARANDSFGLTTLRNKHVRIHGSELSFKFRGKSGKDHSITLHDPKLARIVKRCQELPGQRLFEYRLGDGRVHGVTSGDVNEYLRDAMREDFTAKDHTDRGEPCSD